MMKKALPSLLISAMLVASGCTPATEQKNDYYMKDSQGNTTGIPKFTAGKDPQLAMPGEGEKIAVMETDFGTIKIRLFTKDVPTLTRNFMGLAKSGKYDGTPFHRVVKNFMIQGGDFTNGDGTGGYSYKGPGTNLPNEINPAYHHLYGTLSMAKTNEPVSIGSQFFIVTNKEGTSFLDGKYSPIGQVFEGQDVADKIAALEINNTEKPSQIVKIKTVTITTYTNDKTGSTQS